MMLMLLTGQRVRRYWLYRSYAALLWGDKAALTSGFCGHEADEMVSALTPPMFDHMLSESKIARRPSTRCFTSGWVACAAGLRIGTIGLMVLISAMNGLKCGGHGQPPSPAGTLKRGYDKRMVTGVIQAGQVSASLCHRPWCWSFMR
jgi:hypothetical protein